MSRMIINPVIYAYRAFRRKFPEEFKKRQTLAQESGPQAVLEYVFNKYRHLGKDFTCANCWACERIGIRGDFTPMVKCRYVLSWRPLWREPCAFFVPKWENGK